MQYPNRCRASIPVKAVHSAQSLRLLKVYNAFALVSFAHSAWLSANLFSFRILVNNLVFYVSFVMTEKKLAC